MKPEDKYHVGIIVDDFDETLAWYSKVFGYRWAEPVDVANPIVTPAGEQTVQMRMTYSVEEPRIEIIQSIPGTLWEPADSGVHHVGYWTDDVVGDVATLTASGMTLDVSGLFPDGSMMWAYCGAPGRQRTELVSRALEPSMRQWWASGAAR
ncbi:VOC family protein [Frankia sp. AgB1.9]|uniref:VOC family protein n=1 Tax=unclassified Frankia TaxID=2632575 RepID=UPI00193491FC|nr:MULTISPECIES: VOC family protein [unclassified Frankia]MBL7493535.1 VOC family protein [Frankia sp. AgW1.1]MBL7551678.1 VOC family protein [Frankia sp. AgB1.9]MBL7620214.1 VOC family protein [Frankia sp. AgB1.8]